jgi:hypothetical protein
MASTVLYMSMSLDGFIAGPNEGPDNGLGEGATGCTSGSFLAVGTTLRQPLRGCEARTAGSTTSSCRRGLW